MFYKRRQLEQRRGELPDGEPQHERPDEPQHEPRIAPCPEFRWKVVDALKILDGTDRFPVGLGFGSVGKTF